MNSSTSTNNMFSDSDESLPSGRQYSIKSGNTSAVITELGAGLREFTVESRQFLDTYSRTQPPNSSRGQVLIPFPNRIDHGVYTFDGVKYQVPLNEPDKDNAIHGFTRWMNWNAVSHQDDTLVMALVLHAQGGYPFVLSIQLTYTVSPGNLRVETTAVNIGATPLPYGSGYHPYLTVGTDLVDTDTLQIPAQSYFRTNNRMIPLPPAVPVENTEYDFRQPHAIGNVIMDTGFADLIRDSGGYVRATLSAPGGKPSITLYADANYKFLQVYTGDTLSVAGKRRRSLAIEPYTCAANAFNNGLGLLVLQPGQSNTGVWGLSVSP